tara:strand:+ start:12961 stop:13365 length:405 start_codon:yes stop_codon:yes gene_type:complete
MAIEWSKLSHSKRKQVGALIVKDGMIISDGYNGTPSGFENECEEFHDAATGWSTVLKTKWYVLHAEANAILKCAKHGQSCNGSTLYLTMSPCRECSKLILQSGIKRVVYLDEYRDIDGIQFLDQSKIKIQQFTI